MIAPLWSGFSYYAHQPEAIQWMMKQEDGVFINDRLVRGGLLGDEMGLGKTIEVAGLLKNSPVPKTLIIAPLAVMETWAGVLRRCDFTVWTLDKNSWTTDEIKGDQECYIVNPDKLVRLTGIYMMDFDRVIIDEAHRIRNPSSRVFQACCRIKAPRRWALTATPIVNGLKDVVSLYRFIGAVDQITWTSQMAQWSNKVVFHRSLDQLRSTLAEAPPKPRIQKVVCPFETEEEEEFYHGIQGSLLKKAKRYANDISVSGKSKLKMLLRLRQMSVHPQVYISALRSEMKYYGREDWTGPSTKCEAMGKLLEDKERKTIVVCNFVEEMALLETFIKERDLATQVWTYNGSMSSAERQQTVEEAQAAGAGAVVLLQLQAGGVGINLQTFDRVIFMSSWWNSAAIDQAIGRAVRMGQRKTVDVYHIMLEAETESEELANSLMIDEIMNEKVEAKRELLVKFWDWCD